ncbi:hypothetical protein LY76DRAFT_586917 [Colletotrichum caudatum]|nr:hypothetical protein LY76DRAFT_586917 [Colletotrichum caudatum]
MLPSFFLAFFGGILLIPAQAEDAPTLKSLGSLPSLRISRSGLPVNSAAVNGACDTRSVSCNGRCVPWGSNCCPVDGYCAANAYCSGNGCCPLGKVCNGTPTTCGDDEKQCGSYCMPASKVCCSNGGYCNEGETCTADGLCSGSADDGPNCDPGTAACGSRCMPTDAVCCKEDSYCDAGETCVEGGSCRGSTTSNMPQTTTAGLGGTMSASAGAPRGAHVNHAALAVGLCATVPLVI